LAINLITRRAQIAKYEISVKFCLSQDKVCASRMTRSWTVLLDYCCIKLQCCARSGLDKVPCCLHSGNTTACLLTCTSLSSVFHITLRNHFQYKINTCTQFNNKQLQYTTSL